jgi:hypothetical protein
MRTNAPTRLTVIVPCYNVEAYAATTLMSLTRSRRDDIEFILVDDASTDGTPAVLAGHAEALGRVRVLTRSANGGASAARNTGLDAATGTYVAFLDGDDWVEPGYYPKLLDTIERLGCDMVRTDHVIVHGRKRTLQRIAHGPRGVVMPPREAILPAERATSVDAPSASAGVYHRRLADCGVLRFPEHLRTAEDRLWIWRLHLRVPTFAVVGLAGVFYRRGLTNSLSTIGDERQLDFLDAQANILTELTTDPDYARFRLKAVRGLCTLVDRHLTLRARLSPALDRRLVERSRAALAALPGAEVATAVASLSEERRSRLQEVLPA